MYGIFLSALNTVLGFLVRSVIVKFAVFFGLFFITTEFMPVISYLMPSGQNASFLLGRIPAGVWYFLDMFNVSTGLSVVVSSYATRFIIRRIPVIG